MFWLRVYHYSGVLTAYKAPRHKAWRKVISGLILDDEECLQSGSNSSASQISVDIHDMHLLGYLLCCMCYPPVIREVNSHLNAGVPTRTHMLPDWWFCFISIRKEGIEHIFVLGRGVGGCWSHLQFFLEEAEQVRHGQDCTVIWILGTEESQKAFQRQAYVLLTEWALRSALRGRHENPQHSHLEFQRFLLQGVGHKRHHGYSHNAGTVGRGAHH